MARIDIRGIMIPNDYKWYYDYFGEDSTCPRDVRQIMESFPEEKHDVYINSPGGIIDVGSEIYTMLREHTPGVNIKITGQACSAASVAAMAGYSEMSPTALLMVHCVSSGARGNHSDMEHAAEMLRTADQALCRAYVQKTGMTEQEALEMMEHETWLTADMALERGLIDKIMFEDTQIEPFAASLGFQLPDTAQLEAVRKLNEQKNIDKINMEQAKREFALLEIAKGE